MVNAPAESFAFWQAEEQLGARVPSGFRACGYLFTAHSQDVLDRLAANVQLQHEAGLPSRIVSATEAAELVPGLDPSSLAGAAWCATDGYFDRPLPIEPEERFRFLSAPMGERLLEPLVVSAELRFAAKQLGNGRVLTSDLGAAGDPEAGLHTWRANVRAGIRTLVPALAVLDAARFAEDRLVPEPAIV